MRLIARLTVAAILIVGLASCGAGTQPTADPSLIAVPTQDPEPAGSPRACPAALIEGILVSDERWGLAIQDPEGLTREVLWPHGYAARREASRLALIDANGSVVAHEGDRVQIGGGETGSDGAWLGCGGIHVGAGA